MGSGDTQAGRPAPVPVNGGGITSALQLGLREQPRAVVAVAAPSALCLLGASLLAGSEHQLPAQQQHKQQSKRRRPRTHHLGDSEVSGDDLEAPADPANRDRKILRPGGAASEPTADTGSPPPAVPLLAKSVRVRVDSGSTRQGALV